MTELGRLRTYLFEHCYGRAKGQTMADIALALGRRSRDLRLLVQELRLRGCPICAHPTTGYYWAETPEDLEMAVDFLRRRALCSLTQVSRLQRFALPLLAGQMVLGESPEELLPKVERPVSLVVELPQALHERVRTYLDDRTLGQDDLMRRAIAQFLLLQGVALPAEILAELAVDDEDLIGGEM